MFVLFMVVCGCITKTAQYLAQKEALSTHLLKNKFINACVQILVG